MSDIFITSDEHYGHERILELAKRPFASVYEMNDELVRRHNKKVPDSKNVLTIHVGDMFWNTLTMKQAFDILYSLNGKHALLFGNHDELIERMPLLREAFSWVRGENKVPSGHLLAFNKHKLTLNHWAQRVWEGSHKGHWHCYGHSHNALPGIGKSFDIGVDGHDFTPWSLEEIEAKMETLSPHHTIDNTGRGTVDMVRENFRRGTTVHSIGGICGFCNMGLTKA